MKLCENQVTTVPLQVITDGVYNVFLSPGETDRVGVEGLCEFETLLSSYSECAVKHE